MGIGQDRSPIGRAFLLDCHPRESATGFTHLLRVTQGVSTGSPLPLWERDRVRGLAPAGAEESVAGERTRNLNGARSLPHFHVST